VNSCRKRWRKPDTKVHCRILGRFCQKTSASLINDVLDLSKIATHKTRMFTEIETDDPAITMWRIAR
jgi:hypothetical protein